MSFSDEYFELKKKRKKEEKNTKKTSYSDEYEKLKGTTKSTTVSTPVFVNKTAALYKASEDDVAPTREIAKTILDGDSDFRQGNTVKGGGRFSDEDDKDFDLGTFGDWLGQSAMSGLASFNKSLTSTADLILGKPLQALGWEKNPISSIANYYSNAYDKYKEETEELKGELGGGKGYDYAGDIVEGTVAAVPDMLLAIMSAGTSLTGSAAKTTSGLATKAAYEGGNLLSRAGLKVSTMMKNPQYWLSFGRTYGTDYEEAKAKGASDSVAAIGSTITSLINAGVEIGIDGLSGIQGLPDNVAKGGKKAILEWVESSFEEGTEEDVQGVVSNIVSKLFYDPDTKVLDTEELLTNFGMGAAVGGILGGGQIATMKAANAVNNAIQENEAAKLTENEEAVVNKIVEDRAKEEGKSTAKEKAKIREEVIAEMDKGYISIDTIEEVLGGDTYKSYKDTIDSEEAMLKEYDELGRKKDATLAEQTRFNELHEQIRGLKDTSQRINLKNQLGEEVFSRVQGDRLLESYNERGRRGQAFEADLSQYDSKYHDTYKKATESGILNNTRRTHEFVDMIAKISADKGVLFDFTNNQKLRDSGFAVDNADVNGYVTKDGVTLNIDSNKSLNSVVGHEITHVLEGTEFYDVLQQTIVEYAKSKGEYQSRYDAIAKLYENVEGANVDAELTADLVGDYLFTDPDFIHNLSTNHRNVFQKIWDEVKYLCKVATAGSKEARELAKVEKAFADAYRGEGKVQEGTKYSVSDKNIKDVSTGYGYGETYFTMSYTQDGKVVGTLEYGEYDGEPNVKMVEVDPEYRRQGIGKKLLQELQMKYPDTEISFGMTTPDGTKLLESITYDVTDEAVVADRQKLKDLQTELNELQEKLDVLYDTDNLTEAQETELHKLGDRWQEVYETIHELEQSLRGKRATKTYVKTDTKYSLSDSDGKQLTKEQNEYFKDSKMRDDDGNLMVMYHGSQDAGFHVFDPKMSDDDTSLFFVDRNDVAASYSGTTETYEAKSFDTAEDANKFFAEIGRTEYTVIEKDGEYTLYDDGGEVATSKSLAEIYEEFCDYEGVGYGSANYKVYLNLTNPLVVDVQGRNWDNISREFSQEVYDGYQSLTAEEKEALAQAAGWEDMSIFRDELRQATDGVLASAYEKLGGEDANMYDMFTIASDNFSEESLREFAVKQFNTRDYAQRAKKQGYDGVIFKNIVDVGGYGGEYTPSTVAIAFDSNQIKSVANEKPTSDPDIRYSLSRNAELMQNAEDYNNSHLSIDLNSARQQRQEIYDFMTKNADRLKLPEDIEGNTAIKNSSYDITEENTTVCIRSMAADALCDAVAEELGRPLTVQDTLRISQDLMNYTDEPECVYCYVATDRRAYREFLGSYYEQMQDAIEAIRSGKDSNEVYQEFLNGRKDTKNMRNRFTMWEKIANGGKMISAKDLASEKMMQNAMKDPELSAQVKDARAYAQSASWAKKRMGYQAYNGHIMNWSQRRINDLNKHYGLRFYSFSDFSPAFILENMQQMTDAAVRGLKGLAYTKVLDFAEIFAPTGININVSVFGYDQNGVVAQDGMMGADWKGAQDLRNRYENVGITFVATNDSQIEWALNQDWIDVVIPYHLVRTGQAVAKHFGYTNYTSESGDTKGANWKKGDKKTIYPSEHNNDKQTYLDALEQANLEPRFARWVNHPNYMKLVNETRRAASDTPPIQAVFNVDAAKASLQNMMDRGGYFVPIGGDYTNMQDIASDIADDIRKGNQYSLSEPYTTPKSYGKYNVYGEDVRLEEAPVKAPVTETVETPDDFAPVTEDEAEAINRDAFDSLTDEDAPPEVEAPYYESQPVTVESPFENRILDDVGDRKVKAYMYENPEVKPFFQAEAERMLTELANTTKGERLFFSGDFDGYGSDSYYRWMGTKRHTSEDLEWLLDGHWNDKGRGYTYKDIENGLKAIIEDHGAENNAVSKRIEFLLNDRLMYGYKDFDFGMDIPPNQDYINLLNEKQITEYNEEAFEAFMAHADEYAPPVEEDIAPVAPVKEAYEAIRPKQEKQPRMARATPQEQARASVLTEEPKVEKKKSGAWSMFTNNFVDKGTIFETLSLKTGNRELQGRWKSIGRAESSAQWFMEHGSADASSLKSIRETVENSGKTQQFYEYLYHLHNTDRMNLAERYEDVENKPVFGYDVTSEMSKAEAAKLEAANPEFKEYAKEVYDYMTHLREMLVDGGVISRETAKLWSEMYPHYVPVRRKGDEGLNINVALDTKRTGVNAPVKKATGGNRDILPLFDTMAMRTEQTFKAIAKNRFGVELKNILGTTIEKDAVDLDETIDSIDMQDGLLQEGKDGRNPTFTVFENGEKVTFEITEEMYDAMKPKSKSMAYTNKALNTANNIRRGLLTEYNPAFMLTNPIKDTQDVLMNSQHPARTYANYPKAISELWNKNGQYYQEYMEHGGEQNTYFDDDTKTFVKEKTGLKKVIGFPLEKISAANNFIERVPRMAEYIASRKMGRSIDVSMLDAARVTTDFSAGGDMVKFLNRNGATFLNASVQGAVQQVRNVREAKANGLKGALTLAAKVAVAGMPSILLNHLLWDDDEEYAELSDYVKQNYYIVGKYGDGKFVRIPKGRALAVIQNAFEQMENFVTGNDEVDLRTFGELLISNLAPNNPLDNNIFAPIGQALSNTTWYGDELVPSRLQDLPAEEQFDETTDSISKWLGERLNVSPYKINYLLDQYSGGIGDAFLPMLTPEAERGNGTIFGDLIAPLSDKFTTDGMMKNQNVSDFYDKMDELTVNANAKDSTEEDVLMRKYMTSINSELAELYAEKREIQNGNMSDEEKYDAVREIQSQIVDLTRESLNTYDDIDYQSARDGEYANIGNRYFKRDDEGEWQKLSDDQVIKYKVTSEAGDAPYASDGEHHYRWYEPDEDSDGEAGWRKITDKQLEKQEEVTSGLGISAEKYWSNKEEYDYAYEYPAKYGVAKAVGGYEAYKGYSSELYDIKADKDEYGKSISGSRKEKVADYINGLDADYYTKIILFKKEYNSEDTYNYEIIEYLNGRKDISFEEEILILRELGFEVDSEGNISW